MVRLTASEARREFFRILDSVEMGEEVVLERRGIRFRVTLDPSTRSSDRPHRKLEVTDDAVLAGEWTWVADSRGRLQFQPRGKDR